MSQSDTAFMIRVAPRQLQDINTGGKIVLTDGVYRVTRIQSVKRTRSGLIEIKGMCKEMTTKQETDG